MHSAVGSKDYRTEGRKPSQQSYSRYISEQLSIGPGPLSHHRKNCCPSSSVTRMGVIHPTKWLAEDGWGTAAARGACWVRHDQRHHTPHAATGSAEDARRRSRWSRRRAGRASRLAPRWRDASRAGRAQPTRSAALSAGPAQTTLPPHAHARPGKTAGGGDLRTPRRLATEEARSEIIRSLHGK